MKKQVKNTIESLNEIVYFDEHNFDIGMKILNDNLAKFIGIKEAFKKITGSNVITNLDTLHNFIVTKSGFPNLRASVELLDFADDYDFIITNYDLVDMDMIDAENDCVPADVINDFRIDKTVRLADDPEHDFQVLKKVNELFATLKCKHSYHATNGVDVNVFMLHEHYRIANSRTH